MPTTSIGEVREERRRITDRMLVIEADLAESRRAWLVERGGMTEQQRATAEAELASLRLVRNRLNIAVKDEERAMVLQERQARQQSLLAIVLDLLESRGLNSLIDEAQQRMAAAKAAQAEPVSA